MAIKRKDSSELIFKDIIESKFGGYIKIVYNGNTIYDDADEGLYLDHKLIHGLGTPEGQHQYQVFLDKYGPKKVYNFYCRVVEFHHTELYIEGE